MYRYKLKPGCGKHLYKDVLTGKKIAINKNNPFIVVPDPSCLSNAIDKFELLTDNYQVEGEPEVVEKQVEEEPENDVEVSENLIVKHRGNGRWDIYNQKTKKWFSNRLGSKKEMDQVLKDILKSD